MLPPTYKTNRFLLKPYGRRDEDQFIEMALDPISMEFMGGSTGIVEEERKLFKKVLKMYNEKGGRWFWIWGIYENDRLCGHLEMKETEHTNEHQLEVVYMIHPLERRKGMMTEILSFLKKNQKSWNRRIIATVSQKNMYSIALLNKWGIEKKEVLVNGETGEEYLKFLLEV